MPQQDPQTGGLDRAGQPRAEGTGTVDCGRNHRETVTTGSAPTPLGREKEDGTGKCVLWACSTLQ